MRRDAVRLGEELAAGRTQEAGEVVALTEDRAARGPRHHPSHVEGAVVELLLDDRAQDGIESRLLDQDRKREGEGKSVSVRVDLGGRRIIKKKNRTINET